LRFLVDVARHAALALDNARLYRDAQEANRLKEDFLATLSHELRTPLNALLGWTHLLKMRRADEALRVRAIESIERNAQAQAHLINDLLDVSRIISGKIVLDPQHVDLVAVVNAAVEAVRPGVRMRDIDLSVSAEPIDGVILGDAARLQQVVLNLLSNAMKFTPGRGRIHVSVEQAGGAVQVSVADTGEGIDPAFLPRIFERFSQADNTSTRAHGGLGLGLAIVRTIVELHGGAVWAESEGRGKGSRFIVMLPTRTPIEQPASRDSTRQDDEER
jgi:signal transduction histidine kinase